MSRNLCCSISISLFFLDSFVQVFIYMYIHSSYCAPSNSSTNPKLNAFRQITPTLSPLRPPFLSLSITRPTNQPTRLQYTPARTHAPCHPPFPPSPPASLAPCPPTAKLSHPQHEAPRINIHRHRRPLSCMAKRAGHGPAERAYNAAAAAVEWKKRQKRQPKKKERKKKKEKMDGE
ncbi:hypothetical protein IWX49DRAFT_40491 [Phyllosticta citricarpa]